MRGWFLQALAIDSKDIEKIIGRVPRIFPFAGAGAKHRRRRNVLHPDGDVEPQVRASSNRPLEVQVWLPPKGSSEHPRLVEKVPHERPNGIFIRIKQNQNLPLTRQPAAEVERRNAIDIEFGSSGGGPSSAEVGVGTIARIQEFANCEDDDEAQRPGRSTRILVRNKVSEVVASKFQGGSPPNTNAVLTGGRG